MTDDRRLIAVSVLDRCFADDLVGSCARCDRRVYYRPHTTTVAPIVERICIECYAREAKAGDEYVTSIESLREFALLQAANGKPQ